MNINVYKKYCLRVIVVVILLMSGAYSYAGEFAVSPMLIDVNASPRTVQPFAFNLYGKSTTDVKISIYSLNQLETGYMGFTPAAFDNLESIASWVELDEDKFQLREGDVVKVTGNVKIPSRASGTQAIALMVEENLPDESKSGINVLIRYAVILNLEIEGRYKRIETEFSELVVVEQDGEHYLQGIFENNSSNRDWLFSEVQLRDESNRLIERVSLKSQSAWQRADEGSQVYPNARVSIFGKISKPVDIGNYKVLVRNNFAGKSQRVYRDELYIGELSAAPSDIAEAQIEQDSDAVNSVDKIKVTPDLLSVTIRNSGDSFTSFYIQNDENRPVTVRMPAILENAKEHGIAEFQFFPETVQLRPKQKARVVLNQKHAADVSYGEAVFRASIVNDQDQEISPLLIRAIAGS